MLECAGTRVRTRHVLALQSHQSRLCRAAFYMAAPPAIAPAEQHVSSAWQCENVIRYHVVCQFCVLFDNDLSLPLHSAQLFAALTTIFNCRSRWCGLPGRRDGFVCTHTHTKDDDVEVSLSRLD